MKVAVIYNKMEVRDSDVINVFGLQTKERYSPEIVDTVARALEKGGHNVRVIEGNMNLVEALQNFMPRVVGGERPGMVFNMAYGIQGLSRYTHIPAMLEMLGIPYVGSGPAGHAIALDKVLSKIIFLQNGLPTPGFRLLSSPEGDVGGVRYPVIVKPKMEAVSFGLRIARAEKELREAVGNITREFQQQALVEEFVPGREFAVGLLGNGPHLKTLPVVEIDFEGNPNGFQSMTDKMRHPRGKICPAKISHETAKELERLSRDAFNALGLFDFARVDFRMDPGGKLYILEINSMASLNLTGSFVRAAKVAGLDFPALVNRMLDVAAVRYFGKSVPNGARRAAKTSLKGEPLHVRVRGYLRSNVTGTVDALEKMVSIQSHVHNIEGVNALGEWVSQRFRGLGFRRKVYPQAEAGNVLYFTNRTGEKKDILILGHLDIVYDYENFLPCYEEHGRIFGSGVAESKGGIAVVLAALRALQYAGELRNVRCGVLLTSDDSLGGRFSRDLVADLSRDARHVVGTKYGGLAGGIVTSCSGSQDYQIELTNIKNARNAVVQDVVTALCRKIVAWEKLRSARDRIGITIHSYAGKRNPGRRSDCAGASLTAHFVLKEQSTRLDRAIREIAEKGTDGSTQVQVHMVARRWPVQETKANRQFFQKVARLAGQLEVRVEKIHRDVSADICHVPPRVPVLGGLGPIGGDIRSPGEFIVRDSLIDRSTLLAMLIRECSR